MINTTLRFGSRGLQVQCLQTKLGITSDGIFGPKTLSQVKSFQTSKSLISDGIVGPKTFAVINVPKVVSTIDKVANQEKEISPEINPNLTNLDQFIEIVKEVSKEKGYSETELKLIEDTLRKGAEESDLNFNEEFQKMLELEAQKVKSSSGIFSPLSALNETFLNILSYIGVRPNIAQAATGIPFGGAIVYTQFCPISANWMIGITPLPPSFAVLLSYYPGTQGFASYNIPFTNFLLGEYEPVGACVMTLIPPITIPTQGTITPLVGSSPL